MSIRMKTVVAVLFCGISTQAAAAGWTVQPANSNHGAILSFGDGEPISYHFECSAKGIVATQTGVTKLLDLGTGKTIGDDADAVMPPGAALMALAGDKGEPKFVPAEAVKNPAGGWDLTITIAKNDKQLKAIGKSGMISLFTTGYTMAVEMDVDARTKWNDFVRGCNTGG